MLASGQRRTIHQCSHIRNAQIIRSHLFVAFRATHLRVFSFVYNVGQHYFVCIAAVWTLSPPSSIRLRDHDIPDPLPRHIDAPRPLASIEQRATPKGSERDAVTQSPNTQVAASPSQPSSVIGCRAYRKCAAL